MVTFAIVQQNGREEPSHSRATGSLLASTAAGSPSVTLLGPPGKVERPTTLKASARARSGRIVAVTFLLDGAPLGSDTIAPYRFTLNPGLVRPGRHALTVAVVDNHGRRSSTRAAGLTTERYRTQGPDGVAGAGLERALAALRRGHVTVRLAPGRYRLNDVKIGDDARLIGSGPRTVITAPGTSYFAVLVARGAESRSRPHVDGGGPGPGRGNCRCGLRRLPKTYGSRRLRLTRVRTGRRQCLGRLTRTSPCRTR